MKKQMRMVISAVVMFMSGFMTTAWGVTAVDFGGTYDEGGSVIKATVPTATGTGDYDFDTASDDARVYAGMDSLFDASLPALKGKNNVLNAGAQLVNFNSEAPPKILYYRYVTSSETGETYLHFSNSGVGATTDMGAAFAPYITKINFLNGMDAAENLRFDDASGSAKFSLALGGCIARALVKNGSNWYVSDTTRTKIGT